MHDTSTRCTPGFFRFSFGIVSPSHSKAMMSERLRPPEAPRCGGSSAGVSGFDWSAGYEGIPYSRPLSTHKNLFGKGFGHAHPFLQ